jgi:hypothetical protein
VSSLLLGVAAACAASTMYNLGIALQAVEARASAPEQGMQLSLVAGLLRRPRWLAGTLLTILGWPLQTAALLLAPLSVVQPALASGLVLLLVIAARDRHERVGGREIAAVAAIIAGVGVLAAVVPTAETAHAAAGPTAAVLVAIALVGLAPFVAARRGPIDGRVAALGAGAGFAWSGLSTKYVADSLGGHLWLAALAWALATGLASGLALIGEMTALQSRGAARVAPVVFVVQVVLPVIAAPLLVGEQWTNSVARSASVCGALVVVIAGALALMSSPTVTAFVSADQRAADLTA